MRIPLSILVCLFLAVWLNCSPALAQQNDTARQNALKKLRDFAREEMDRSIDKFREGSISIRQRDLLENIRTTTQRANFFMKRGLDTMKVLEVLENTQKALATVKEGVFVNPGISQTQRNLAVTNSVLIELQNRINVQKARLDTYAKTLGDFRFAIDSLSGDTVLYSLPADSAAMIKYLRKLVVVAKEIGPTDSILKGSLATVQDLQNRVDLMAYELRSARDETDTYRRELSARNFDREYPNLWQAPGPHRPFGEVLQYSLAKEKLALSFYLQDTRFRIFLLIILVAAAALFLRALRHRLINENTLDPDFKGQLVIRYPLLSAIFIVLNLFQFIFPDPPFVFSFSIWLINTILLAIIFHRFISPYWMRFWLLMILLFLVAGLDNFALQATRAERWIIAAIALAGMLYAIAVLGGRHKHELRERGILYFIVILVLFQTASLGFNVFGRYNLAKTLVVAGYVGVVVAILFLWTVRLINEGLAVASSVYKHPERKLFFINFDRVGNKVPWLFYVLLVIGWFIVVGRNFYSFRQVADPINTFITRERMLGEYAFSVESLLIFLAILFVSFFLSRIISFFSTDPGTINMDNRTTRGLGVGSWILLIRIFIICLGVFLAFAATGIPVDRITIILGALGVGIGLGLQGLVNNLVSGLIIAFEKPVNVGDIIEVNGKPGTMKSIGFRSSVVSVVDGACVVIPNGDLLNQHLVNWTMGKNHKRISVVVGVKYGTDVLKVKSILESVLAGNNKVMQQPPPFVIVKDFNQSSIDFELLFWVHHIKDWLQLKSEVIAQVNLAFAAEGIVIPFPQRDLHVRTLPDKPLPGKPGENQAP